MRTVDVAAPGLVRLIDQRQLPHKVVILDCQDYRQMCEAIRTLAVRGAPAIGVAAAAGLALAAHELAERYPESFWGRLEGAAEELKATRPTAVNLFWGVDRAMKHARALQDKAPQDVAQALHDLARRMADEDVGINLKMAEHGQSLIKDGSGVLTHCNTGALATVDYGTALGVIRRAHEKGRRLHVYVDETRPVLQGARLTAWECLQHGIPATLITDNMAAHFMRLGKIHVCFVGADRVAANGDVANKIGTYAVAILCKEHGVPFYVVAPTSTIDLSIPGGDAIVIEERSHEEVTHIGGVRIAPEGIGVANPAFDVAPARYVTGIVTEKGIVSPPYTINLMRALSGGQ